jgi:hypothetical protein
MRARFDKGPGNRKTDALARARDHGGLPRQMQIHVRSFRGAHDATVAQ